MQATYWIGTIAAGAWSPSCLSPLCQRVAYVKGQREIGDGGFEHWQVFVQFTRNVRLGMCKDLTASPTGHWEPTRSKAAEEYVWKEDTRVEGTQFELGRKPINRAKKADWGEVLASAKSGNFETIPPDILVRCYAQITRISKDYMVLVCNARFHLQLKGLSKCTGGVQELERVDLPGMNQGWLLILKTHLRSGGTVTAIRNALLSMNSEEELRLNTYYDGLTVTQSVWRLKEELWSYELIASGSHQISLLMRGIQN